MAAEPFANVPDDILQDILLRLPSSASLVRAALVYKHWGRIISSSTFLTRYRKLHPSSPLLGYFFSERPFGLPDFRLADTARSDPDLKAVLRRADVCLLGLEQDSRWRILDSRNGHLLLCRQAGGETGGDSFSIYNPVTRRLVTIPQDRPHDDDGVAYFGDCLLPGDDGSFRVVSVQQHHGMIRAVDYDPDTRKWSFRRWQSPWALERPRTLRSLKPMYAGAGLVFWSYSKALALVLDCSSMKFSMCTVPISCYAIGEIEDGVGCLVDLDDLLNATTHGVLKLWLLNTAGGTITWELSGEQQTPVTELLGADARVRQVVQVTNGLALVSFDDRYDQFVIDLKNQSLHAEFVLRGQPYAYQMAWPPVGLPALQEICKVEPITEEAQPVQLVLPGEPAPPLDDDDVAAPMDDAGLAAPLDDDDDFVAPTDDAGLAAPLDGDDDIVAPMDDAGLAAPIDNAGLAALIDDAGLAAPIDDVAYTEGPSVQQPTTALDDHLHQDCPGECPHHGALPTKPRCEEKLQPAGDVPPEHKGQGPTMSHTVSNFDLDADVQDGKAKAKLATTGKVRVDMIECPMSFVPLEAGCEDSSITEEAQAVQLVLPVESAPPLQMSTCQMVDLAAPIADEGPLEVLLRRLDLCVTEHVMDAEANNFVRTVEDGMRLMETKPAETAAPSADLVDGMAHSIEAISRKQICEGVVSSFRVDPSVVPAPCFPPMSLASNNHSPAQFFEEATYAKKVKSEAMYTQKVKNSEELPDMETEKNDTPVNENQNLNQGHESLTADRQDFALAAQPSDQELIESYLRPHVDYGDKFCGFIHDGDVYAAHPADLTREYDAAVSRNGHKVWYFFTTMRARGGCRKARTLGSGEGFWHSEGKLKAVNAADHHRLGYRRYLTFARKECGRRVRSKWVMVEFSLRDHGKDEVTLCKVYVSPHPGKNNKGKASADTNNP